jgi:hypothetical protein
METLRNKIRTLQKLLTPMQITRQAVLETGVTLLVVMCSARTLDRQKIVDSLRESDLYEFLVVKMFSISDTTVIVYTNEQHLKEKKDRRRCAHAKRS